MTIMMSILIDNWIAILCYWILSAMIIFSIFTEAEENSREEK